jgi:predicted HTH domain antitoxin
MPLTLSDADLDVLRAAAPEALIEIACRLYDADRIAKPQATRLTGLSRAEFEEELTKRGLPWIRINYDETYEREFAKLRAELPAAAPAKQGS